MLKKVTILAMLAILGGCATHAEIKAPVVTQIHSDVYEGKTLSLNILYSQPKPGVFSGGEQLPLVPIENAELSVASSATLRKLPTYILDQLPASVKQVSGQGDFNLVVAITAHDKKGPAYADYELGKSFGKSLITLGFGSDEYNIIADFDAKYTLYHAGKQVFTKDYKVEDSVDHERGKLEGISSTNDFASQLLEKHLIITLNNFFKEAEKAI